MSHESGVEGINHQQRRNARLLSPQWGFVHNRRVRKVCNPRHTKACDLTPERRIDCYSTITKL
jgi:hypothetical protein